VSDPLLTEEQLEEEIEKMKEEAMEDPDQEKETTDFMLYEIPRTLSMLEDIDEINAKLETIKSNLDTLIFGRFLGSDERILKGVVYNGEDAEVSEGEPIEEEELLRMIEEAKEERKEKKNLPPKESTKFDPFKDMTKAERQKKVKEENRDKRIIKIPKHVRKAIIKKTSGKQT
jgi:BioD-like phosphotransacetylase family protein